MANEPVLLIFPHQLFRQHPGLEQCKAVMLVEDGLFFGVNINLFGWGHGILPLVGRFIILTNRLG